MLPASVNTKDAVSVENMLAAWVDGEPRARMVVNEHLAVYWLSCSAEMFFQEESAILYRNSRLVPRDVRTERSLRNFLGNATDHLSSVCIANGDEGEHLVLTAVRLHAPCEHAIGLTIHAGDRFDFALADVRQAFGFTPSERQVAVHLLKGLTADEAARQLNVSLDTVRVHIKRAYSKLGVGSREAFFHKLAPYLLPG